MDRPSSYWKHALTFVKQNRFLTFVIIVGAVVVAIVVRDLFTVFVRGYAWKPGTGFAGKTLWEWLELLVIPAVLALGALGFNQAVRFREQKIATDQQKETALQTYLDKMAKLLLEHDLKKTREVDDSPVRDVAQVQTVTTLRILDWDRRNILFQFLRDANLADFILVEASFVQADLSHTRMNRINLSGADLTEADLTRAYLIGAHLTQADLTQADLTQTNLIRADLIKAVLMGASLGGAFLLHADLAEAFLVMTDLSGAHLPWANLRGADLTEANLSGADLADATLPEANLTRANLTGADLTQADLTDAILDKANIRTAKVTDKQLTRAKSLKGAIMPNGTVHE